MDIFIPVVGQFTNIGDSLHRRILLSWLKEVGKLHVYIGKAPQSFIDSLLLNKDIILYKSIYIWIWKIIKARYKKITFVFNSGEMRLGNKRLLIELLLFPFLVIVRLKKGQVLRIGIATMANATKNRIWLWKLILKPTSQIYWRTSHSKEIFQRGKIIPDLAFYNFLDHEKQNSIREEMVISMRSDRPFPSSSWFDAVSKFSKNFNLKLNVVSQVRGDNIRTVEIAQKLGAKSILWLNEWSHLDQERILDDLYSKTKLIISDRLHVLIAAYSKGAIPSCMLTDSNKKIQYHFSVIKIEDISILEVEKTSEEIYSFLLEKINNKDQIMKCISEAKKILKQAKGEILYKINNLDYLCNTNN
jgi:hypothetical protein